MPADRSLESQEKGPAPGQRTKSARDKALVGRAWAVHLYTATGLVVGFLSLIYITNGQARETFLLSLLALMIDGTDGFMARKFRVTVHVPAFDGRKLDDITDFINYVLVPCFFAYHFKLVNQDHWGVMAVVLLASGYGFCMEHAKANDGFFTGFPSYWNVMIVYMYALRYATVVNEAVLLIFSILVFVPIKYLYPSKTKPLRWITLPLSAIWFAAIIALIFQIDDPNPVLLYGSLSYAVYYFLASFYLHAIGHHRVEVSPVSH